jgi:hypothetical protein
VICIRGGCGSGLEQGR